MGQDGTSPAWERGKGCVLEARVPDSGRLGGWSVSQAG